MTRSRPLDTAYSTILRADCATELRDLLDIRRRKQQNAERQNATSPGPEQIDPLTQSRKLKPSQYKMTVGSIIPFQIITDTVGTEIGQSRVQTAKQTGYDRPSTLGRIG